MKQKLTKRFIHALLTALLSTGIIMPVLGVMDHSFLNPRVLLLSAVIIVVFEAASLHRIAAFFAAGGLVAGIMIWMLSAGGAQAMSDFMVAMTLRFRGIRTALPLMANLFMGITACILTFICCFACLRRATCIPALILCTGTALVIWMCNRMDLIPWFLPALTAVLTLILISRFEETRPFRILPISAGIVAASFLLAGNGAVIQPLKEQADDLRQMIMDRLFFVESRDVFSLYAVGLSPQGQNQLGGKPNPDNSVMMQVKTPRVTYLRGAIYDEYDGHAWRNTAGGKRYLWHSDRTETDKSSLFNMNLPAEMVSQKQDNVQTITVQMLNDSASTLFVPQRIREMNTGGDMVPYFARSTEVFITRNLRPGDTYEVSAPLYVSGEPGMGQILEICAAMDDPLWDELPDIYTQLPGHLGQQLVSLAQDITKDGGSPYDRAMMIQNWLNRNFQYTLDVGEHPDNIDFVTSFLLDTKKGYCTYFASAMTVLCRMVGLPARYVEGYLAEPDPAGEAIVTGTDAHAWTEIYFKGFGWLTFDATPKQRRTFDTDGNEPSGQDDDPTSPPGQEKPTPTPPPEPPENEPTPTPEPPEDQPTPTPTPEQDQQPTPTPEAGNPDSDEPTPTPEQSPENPPESPMEDPQDEEVPPEKENEPFPWLLMIILIMIGIAGIRIIMTSPRIRSRYAKDENKRLEIWTQELSDLLAAEHLKRRPDETPMGFARRVDGDGFFSTLIGPVGECVSLIRYSAVVPLDTDTRMIRETAVSLKREISRPAKFRYWTRRLFIPIRKRVWTGSD